MLRDSTEGGLSQSSLVCGLLSNRRIPDRAREAKQDSWRPCEGTHGPSEATHVLGPRGGMRSPGSPCRQSTPYKEARTEAPQGPQQLPRVPALCQARPRCWDPGVSSTPRLCPERACSPSVGETSDFPFVDGSAMLGIQASLLSHGDDRKAILHSSQFNFSKCLLGTLPPELSACPLHSTLRARS